MIKEYLALIIGAVLVNNFVLSRILGICPFLGVSKKIKTALGMGGAVIFVMTLSGLVTSIINHLVLKRFEMEYLRTIVFILVIAGLVQIVEVLLQRLSPPLYKALGIFLPLITTNCAVLGVALTNVQNGYSFVESVLSGFGTAVGFTLAIVLLAGIRGRIHEEDLPAPLRGAPIVMISAALMSIAFMGFSGLSF